MTYKTPDPREQMPDRVLMRLNRRAKSIRTKHQSHREHRGTRRK